MFKFVLPIVSLLINLVVSTNLQYETKSINFNSVYSETLQGTEMKFYSIKLEENLNKNDLKIDAKITNNVNGLFESPLLLVSLVIFIKILN